jgi:putative Flp pilus-assembly TadE/G-like protein
MTPPPTRTIQTAGERGQVLVLAALLMVLLIGVTGLAIDISAAYMADRWQRSVADAASLAGGQDLQIPGSKALPGATQYQSARTHAMDILVSELHATATPSVTAGSPCLTPAGCPLPGTPYEVAIRTSPSPSCVDCDPFRAIQVTIRQPAFGLTFARIFGQDSWVVSTTSVAGIVQSRQYGLVTLRPPLPRKNGGDQNEQDIHVTGGSRVQVDNADIGTNSNLIIDGNNSAVVLQNPGAPGPYTYFVWHYDTYQAWGDPPPGSQITSPIEDPDYPIPQRTDVAAGCPTTSTAVCTYTLANLSDAMLGGAAGSALCQAEMAKVPVAYKVGGTSIKNMTPSKVTCYKPGIYTRELKNSKNDEAVLLISGVYFLDKGLDVSSTLVGGYVGNQPGVAIVLPTCPGNNCPAFTGNNSPLVALNFGSAFQSNGQRATAAAWDGGFVVTGGVPSTLMSIMVEPDQGCLAAPFPTLEPSNSCSNRSPQLKLPGGGALAVAGVQYAPTDNTKVTGNSPQTGVLGQIISWTIEFKGSSTLSLEAVIGSTSGILRLDPACSPTVNVCNP